MATRRRVLLPFVCAVILVGCAGDEPFQSFTFKYQYAVAVSPPNGLFEVRLPDAGRCTEVLATQGEIRNLLLGRATIASAGREWTLEQLIQCSTLFSADMGLSELTLTGSGASSGISIEAQRTPPGPDDFSEVAITTSDGRSVGTIDRSGLARVFGNAQPEFSTDGLFFQLQLDFVDEASGVASGSFALLARNARDCASFALPDTACTDRRLLIGAQGLFAMGD